MIGDFRIHCFENVSVVFFVVALSEFNQLLAEDTTTNRVAEAATLFDSIANSRWFNNSGLLLFFNKVDLLEQKLRTTDFRESFPDFAGANTGPEVQQYMLAKFRALYRHQVRCCLYIWSVSNGSLTDAIPSSHAVERALPVLHLRDRYEPGQPAIETGVDRALTPPMSYR